MAPFTAGRANSTRMATRPKPRHLARSTQAWKSTALRTAAEAPVRELVSELDRRLQERPDLNTFQGLIDERVKEPEVREVLHGLPGVPPLRYT